MSARPVPRHPGCTCTDEHIREYANTRHQEGCPTYEKEAARSRELAKRIEEEEAAKRERAARVREQAAAAPKSRRVGRIHDRDSARKELLSMAQTAKGDPRLSPCAAYVYGMLNARGFKHGSVFVSASPDRLSELSRYDSNASIGFSPKQCERALERLRLLGYIEKAKWSRVRKGDPSLYRWAQRLGRPGRWPNAYLLKQDLPDDVDRVPDEENPILEMFGLVPA